MAATLINHRWTAPETQFARRVTLDDAEIPKGWLNNSVVIEPGMRACAVVEGKFLGEVPAGEFTFQTFRDKLQFWRKGQATLLLTRADVVRLPVDCNGFISADNVPIDMRVDIGVQISDPGLFLQNLMGPRKEYPVAELAQRLTPAVKQEAWVATARLQSADLRGVATAAKVTQQIVDAVGPSFRRYGLNVVGLESLSMQAAGMEKHWERVKDNNVEVAGERLTNERMGDDVGILTARIGLREKLRDIALSDTFDKVKTKEELSQFLEGVNKDRLIRKEEIDQLVEGYEQRKDDREAVRNHVVEVLEINRQQEIETLRTTVSHSLQMASLKNDLELADASNAVENTQWRNEIAREIELASRRREERAKDMAAKWERIRERQRQQQDGSWEKLLHEQREESLRTELAIKETDRKNRIAILEVEAAKTLEEQKIFIERQRREFELEIGRRESDDQLDRLKRVGDINFDGHARQVQLEADLKGQAESRAQNHELEKLRTMGTLSAEALIAASNGDNARALAELKMQEAKSQAEIHMAGRTDQQTLNEERLRLYERLSEAEKSKADAIANVFQTALKGQQSAVEQMITGLAAAHTPPRHAPARAAAPPPAPGAVAEWHVIGEGGTQTGPHTLRQVQMMFQQGRIDSAALVWRNGMAGWSQAAECEDLSELFAAVPPPPPAPPPPRA